MLAVIVTRISPCHGEREQPERGAAAKGERLEVFLSDIAAQNAGQQQRRVGSGP